MCSRFESQLPPALGFSSVFLQQFISEKLRSKSAKTAVAAVPFRFRLWGFLHPSRAERVQYSRPGFIRYLSTGSDVLDPVQLSHRITSFVCRYLGCFCRPNIVHAPPPPPSKPRAARSSKAAHDGNGYQELNVSA